MALLLLGIQLIGILFGLFMVYFSFLNYKQNKFTSKEWIAWLVVWAVFLIITVFPAILNPVLIALNLYRAMDFYISIGFLFIIFMLFYTYSIVRTNQQKIEIITREVAFANVIQPQNEQTKRKRKRKKQDPKKRKS